MKTIDAASSFLFEVVIPVLVLLIVIFLPFFIYSFYSDKYDEWTQQATDVAVARNLMRVCTKDLHGTALVETIWAQDVPVAWTITCEWEKE